MSKLLIVLLILLSFQTYGQYGTFEQKISGKLDPEMLWSQVDSLDAVDTTKRRMDLVAYYKFRYECDQMLYRFDNQQYHLENSLKWSSAWCFHDKPALEPLIQCLEMCQKLNDTLNGKNYYNQIKLRFNEKYWIESQELRINNAASDLRLIGYENYRGPIMMDYPFETICCEMDTLVKIHSNAEINANTKNYQHYELVKGEKRYLEVKINTRNCRCSDAAYSRELFVELKDNEVPGSIEFKDSSAFWSTQSSWNVDAKQEDFFGKLFRNEHGLYVIIFYRHNKTDEFYMTYMQWIAPEKLEGLN